MAKERITHTYRTAVAEASPVYIPTQTYRQERNEHISRPGVDLTKAPVIESTSTSLELDQSLGDLLVPAESGFEGVSYFHAKNAVKDYKSREYKNTSILRVRTGKSASRLVHKVKEDPTELLGINPGAHDEPIYVTKTKVKDTQTGDSTYRYFSLVKPTGRVMERLTGDDTSKLAPRQRVLMNITPELVETINEAHLAEEQARLMEELERIQAQRTSIGENTIARVVGQNTTVPSQVRTPEVEAVAVDMADTVETDPVEDDINYDTQTLDDVQASEVAPELTVESDQAEADQERALDRNEPTHRMKKVGAGVVAALRHGRARAERLSPFKRVAAGGSALLAAGVLTSGGVFAAGQYEKTADRAELASGIEELSVEIEVQDVNGVIETQIPTDEGMVPSPTITGAIAALSEGAQEQEISRGNYITEWNKAVGDGETNTAPDSIVVNRAQVNIVYDAEKKLITDIDKEAGVVTVDLNKLTVEVDSTVIHASDDSQEKNVHVRLGEIGNGEVYADIDPADKEAYNEQINAAIVGEVAKLTEPALSHALSYRDEESGESVVDQMVREQVEQTLRHKADFLVVEVKFEGRPKIILSVDDAEAVSAPDSILVGVDSISYADPNAAVHTQAAKEEAGV